MKGLELSERYYYEVCAPMLAEQFSQWKDKIAAGLVGDGSECLGFDDELSQDHDWGAAVCLWLNAHDYECIGREIAFAMTKLPIEFMGFPARNTSALGEGRVGVLCIDDFYRKYLGIAIAPTTVMQWRRIPEHHLAAATNGKVFSDPQGEFSLIRQQLLAYYPNDVRKKKIAARCMIMAQAGQYNYPRISRRGENVALHLTVAEFIRATGSMVYLLNKRYQPFYKWLHRGLSELPVLGIEVAKLLKELVGDAKQYERNTDIIEEICRLTIAELHRQRLSDSDADFMVEHGISVHLGIEDEILQNTNPWVE